MVLAPMLSEKADIEENERFPASVAIIMPICIVSLLLSAQWQQDYSRMLPYLIGSTVGGIAAGLLGKRIPTTWLHRILGVLILWGGIRYLC